MKLKRILASAVAAVMLCAAPMQLGALADGNAQEGDIVTLSPDISGTRVAVTTEGTIPRSGVVIHAAYNDDGSLKKVEVKDFSDITADNSGEVNLDFTYNNGDKLMAWSSLTHMAPYDVIVDPDYIVTEADVADLGWSQFVVVKFDDGYNTENCTLTIDGTDVTKAFTPVTDDGSIAKWELTSLNPAKLIVASGDKTQEIKLTDNENPTAPAVKENTAAGYMIAHGPMAIWDYYLTVYDQNGDVRVEPSKTTFDLKGKATTDAPASYSPIAYISDSGKGTAEIMFNYNEDWEKAWFDAVENKKGSVQLVAYDDNQNTLNKDLDFKKTADVAHGSGKVGQILIDLDQSNFSNGRFYVRVLSEGHDTVLVPIHVVNETAPTMSVTGESEIRSGEDITFVIENMVYGIKNPTVAAELTRPDGETVELEMITDWYQIGPYLYLYNTETEDGTGRNNIPYKGTYTLTVHSDGFKDMSAEFTVSEGKELPIKENITLSSVDMMSSATTYAGGGSDGSGSEGGQQVSADVKFNADLLINAKIIAEHLELDNDAAKAINDRWRSMHPDSVSASDTKLGGFEWDKYYAAVNAARSEGKYLSFADYAAEHFDEEKQTTAHAVKSVLENNLLGDIQNSGEWIGKDCPILTLVEQTDETAWSPVSKVMAGEDINLICNDTEYLPKLESINLNGNSANLTKDTDYELSISEDKSLMLLTIHPTTQNLLVNSKNTITLEVPGYKTNRLSIRYDKEMEENLSLETDKTTYTRGENGTEVLITVTGSEGDFLKYLNQIEITAPDGYKKTALSSSAGGTATYYYEKTGDNTVKLTDSKNTLFADNGEYKITLKASEYYNALDTTIKVNGELKAVPNSDPYISSVDDNTYSVTVKHYLIDFGENNRDSGLDAWKGAIKSVTVNDTEYTEGTLARDKYTWPTQSGNDMVMELYGLNAFKDGSENKVIIKAAGYEDLTLTFNSLADRTAPKYKGRTVTEDGLYRISFDGTEDDINKFLKRLTAVTVDETAYHSSGIGSNSIYTPVKAEGSELYTMLELAPNAVNEYGKTPVTITAKGYTDLSFEIENGERPIITPPSVDAKTKKEKVGENGDADLYSISFAGDEQDAAKYIEAITSVEVGELTYTDIDGTGYASLSKKNSFRKTQENGVYKYLDLTADGIPDYESVTEITIKATGYDDLTFTIDNSDKHKPSAPTPKEVKEVYNSTKDYYRVSFDDTAENAAKYLAKISTVTVGGKEYGSASSFSSYSENKYKLGYDENGKAVYLDLTADGIAEDDTTVIKVEAEGYTDLTYTIDNTNRTLDTAPELNKVEFTESTSDYSPSYYTLSFKGNTDSEISDFLDRIESVNVGGTDYASQSYFFGKNTRTYVINNDSTLSVTADCVASYDGDNAGETAVVIKAKGFNDKTYTIVVNPPEDAPEVSGDAEDKTDYYRISLKGTDEEVNAYLSSIKTVTVGSKAYTLTDEEITDETTNKYKLSKENDGDEVYKYLDLSADGIADTGVTTVIVEAKGYKSLTITIGSEETGLDAPTVSEYPLTEKSSMDYYTVSFNEEGDITDTYISDYIGKITSVTVNGKAYSKAVYNSDFSAGETYAYRFAYDNYSQNYDSSLGQYVTTYHFTGLVLTADGIPQYDSKSDIVVTAEGYKTLKFTIDNSDNHPAAAPEVSEMKLSYSDTKDYYKISFAQKDDIDEEYIRNYIGNINGVTVGETGYKKAYYNNSFYSSESNCYTFLYDESGYDSSYNTVYYYNALALTDDAVAANGATTVTVTSKGYADLTFTIDTTNIVLDTPPAFADAELEEASSSYYHDWYRISFLSDAETDAEKEAEINEFLGRISSVTVGENEYEKTSSSSASKSYYSHLFRIARENSYSYSGPYVYLYLTSDGFAEDGNTEITITAKGYSDLTFTVDKDLEGE